MMKFGIIGSSGAIAKEHREAIEKLGGRVVAEADVNTPLSWQDVVASDAEAISICAPNYLHAPMVLETLNAGKFAVLEKPIATNLKSAKEIVSHPEANRKVAVCYQRRLNKQCQDIKKNATKIKAVDASILVFREPAYWDCWRSNLDQSGGGFLINIAIHYLDLLIWWLGDDYKIQEAKMIHRGRPIEEECLVRLNFGKVLVKLWGSAKHHKREILMKVLLDDGRELIYDTDDAKISKVYEEFFLNKNFASVSEAYKSLKIVQDIYRFSKQDVDYRS